MLKMISLPPASSRPILHRQIANNFYKVNCTVVGCTFLTDGDKSCRTCDSCTRAFGCSCGNMPQNSIRCKIYRIYFKCRNKIRKFL